LRSWSVEHRQELGKILTVPGEFLDWCPHVAFGAVNLPRDTGERKLGALVATGAGGDPERALDLVPVVAEDIQAVEEQVAGVAGAGVTRRAGVLLAAGAPDAVPVFASHSLSFVSSAFAGTCTVNPNILVPAALAEVGKRYSVGTGFHKVQAGIAK